jgi:DNA polymerase-3 subunit delta
MKRDLEAILSEIRKGNWPKLLLIHGDDLRVHTSIGAILDLLIPVENRALNLEQFDGRTIPWDQIEAALMTPPFFPGTKAVLVENAPYFLSRDNKADLGERVLQLWGEGKKDEASRLFLELLLLEEWSQERWEQSQGPSFTAEVAELFDGESKEIREAVEGILAFCRSKGLGLSRGRKGDGHRLIEVMEQGLPPWAVLLITASHLDRRTRLYKRFEANGAVLDLSLERDRRGRISREILAEFLDRRLRESGKRIEPQAREMILFRAGGELWTVHQELEKLLLYIGEDPWIRARNVEELFLDQGEEWVFDLTQAIAERNPLKALGHLTRLMSQGDHPLRLLGPIASEVRRLLAARQLIEGEMRGKWSSGMSYAQFQKSVFQQGAPLLTGNPYADYMSFKSAENFTAQGLFNHLESIYQADVRLKSSANPPRMVMERLILEMCLGAP